MSVFSDEEKQQIAQAIGEAEATTSGEIVVVVAKDSDDYRFIALLWAALLALTLPLLLIYAPRLTGWRLAFAGPEVLYLIQLAAFIVLALFFQWSPVRYALAPRRVRARRVRRAALEQFIARNLHTTSQRTGVLIYVSLAERQAEIIADDGIASKTDPKVWQEAVAALTNNIDAGHPVDGFVATIHHCGQALAAHFPPGLSEINEQPNHLIELD